MNLSRRGIIGAIICAPAIVRASSLMPIKTLLEPEPIYIALYSSQNHFLTIGQITREAIRHWKNSNAFIENVDKQYDEVFFNSSGIIGQQLKIRLSS